MRRFLKVFFFVFSLMGLSHLSEVTPLVYSRDPKIDEMAALHEVAYSLKLATQAAYNVLSRRAGTHPLIDSTLPQMEKLNEKAQLFYNRALSNTKAPWRTTRTYEDLNQAFVEAKEAFISRPTYSVNPPAFEEIAYQMGGLLQFYLYGPTDSYEEGIIYSYPGPGYGQVIYPWVPSFYTFSNCRVFPWPAPWGRRLR